MGEGTTRKTRRRRTGSVRRKNAAVLAAVAAVALLTSAGPMGALASFYTVADLGTLGGSRSAALALNDSGDVVGYSTTAAGATRGFVYDGDSLQAVGTFGGRDSLAYGISNIGTVVGRAQNSSGEFRAFVMLPGGKLLDIPTLSAVFSSAPFSTATAVSTAGLVVGYRLTPGDHMVSRSRIFLFSDSTLADLGTFGGEDAVAAGINDAGQFVGFYGTDAHADYSDRRAFIGRLGGDATDLGTLGGRLTTPTAINDAGQVVGFAQLRNGDSHAFLYTAGSLVDLGTLTGGRQSFAYGLNELGQIVGTSDSAARTLCAFLYTGGQMVDLNTLIPADSGFVLTEARDINAAGMIVGTGIVGNRQHAFLLTPVP